MKASHLDHQNLTKQNGHIGLYLSGVLCFFFMGTFWMNVFFDFGNDQLLNTLTGKFLLMFLTLFSAFACITTSFIILKEDRKVKFSLASVLITLSSVSLIAALVTLFFFSSRYWGDLFNRL